MKKLLAVMFFSGAVIIAGSSSVSAIEKRDKESTPTPPKVEAAERKDAKKPAAKSIKKSPDTTKKVKGQVKKFDDFIDKNNNGIDDRIEEQKKP